MVPVSGAGRSADDASRVERNLLKIRSLLALHRPAREAADRPPSLSAKGAAPILSGSSAWPTASRPARASAVAALPSGRRATRLAAGARSVLASLGADGGRVVTHGLRDPPPRSASRRVSTLIVVLAWLARRRGLRCGPAPVLGLVGALVSNDMQTDVNADAQSRQVAQ